MIRAPFRPRAFRDLGGMPIYAVTALSQWRQKFYGRGARRIVCVWDEAAPRPKGAGRLTFMRRYPEPNK